MSSKIALFYDNAAYVETLERSTKARHGDPMGLMGREVAGKEFLDAYLSHGTWSEMVGLVPDQASRASLQKTCVEHPSSHRRKRRLQCVTTRDFHDTFHNLPPARLIHFPCPPDARFTWARQHGRKNAFALCGVTHTLCSIHGVEALRNLVTAAFQPYDRLICTSRAVLEMVRAITEAYADFLRVRYGGNAACAVPLEVIPLGVNCEKFQPPTPDERAMERAQFNVAGDEIVVLFVGRLSHHAKANPFPMYRAIAEAASRTGAKVHLLMSGWAASPTIFEAFRDGARQFAKGLRCSFVDGTASENRFQVWHAADVFTSLSDNIQETFGLVITEAMACGLPVVATDWNGYRDLVVQSETGFLVPTAMIRNATSDLTLRLLTGELSYDHFLAQASQNVAVDVAAATSAFAELFRSPELRARVGKNGRQRATELFDWRRIIRRYEAVWEDQLAERAAFVQQAMRSMLSIPAAYPSLEHSFAGYPSVWLDDCQLVHTSAQADTLIVPLCSMGITNYQQGSRCHDLYQLRACLKQASGGCTIGDLVTFFGDAGVSEQCARVTLAWMLKYDLLHATET